MKVTDRHLGDNGLLQFDNVCFRGTLDTVLMWKQRHAIIIVLASHKYIQALSPAALLSVLWCCCNAIWWRLKKDGVFPCSLSVFSICLQCFDTVGWVAGRASGLWKTEWWGAGVVICLERDADLHMAQRMPLPLTVSCFSKIQIGFTFLVPAHPGSPRKRAVKQVCMCVCLSPVAKFDPTETVAFVVPKI